MAELQPQQPSFVVRRDQPLIGIPDQEDGQEVTRYFLDDEAAHQAIGQASIQRALDLAGAWEHLDLEEGPDMLDELDRIRHESKPSPPLKL
jgi:hypothetical protein